MTFDLPQQQACISVVYQTLSEFFKTGKIALQDTAHSGLYSPCGVFVSLYLDGYLRGCIGRMVSDIPLFYGIQYMAVSSAFEDTRFGPLSMEEFERVKVEISVLTVPEPVQAVHDIQIGRDGLILRQGDHSGVFLPKVPVDQGWDLITYLQELGRKAGLGPTAWKESELLRFEAEVFSNL